MKPSCRSLGLPHETSASVTYTPDILCWEDSFTFKVNNGYFDSSSATITITVGDLDPQALPQTVMVKKGLLRAADQRELLSPPHLILPRSAREPRMSASRLWRKPQAP